MNSNFTAYNMDELLSRTTASSRFFKLTQLVKLSYTNRKTSSIIFSRARITKYLNEKFSKIMNQGELNFTERSELSGCVRITQR